ncbi:MAG: hypothetical protein R6X25_12335 [Candidatus Krumholzibacteriia bacterium]
MTVMKQRRRLRRLKPYTYLGCPLTRNRTPWCFRLCEPDAAGHGRCGRVAPHTLRGTIQLAIERHEQRLAVARATAVEVESEADAADEIR